jgi:trimethylamine:corrinoid methyltransferase-like protein
MSDSPSPADRPTPPALVASCVLGGLGAVVLVAGLLLDVVAVALFGVALAGLSLGAALVWRSQLIEDWRRQQGGQAGGRR